MILLDVSDADLYVEYAKQATVIEEQHGGRAIIVGDASEVVDGRWPAQRIVVLEFPSLEHARAWYTDPRYEAITPLRHQSTRSQVLLIEGFPDDT